MPPGTHGHDGRATMKKPTERATENRPHTLRRQQPLFGCF